MSEQSDNDGQGDEVVEGSESEFEESLETIYSKEKVYLFPGIVTPSLSDKETFQRQEDDDSVVYAVNTEKLEKGKDKLRGDDSEWEVMKLIKEALEDIKKPGDPAAFILHGQYLDDGKESEQGNAMKSEKDAFVLHRRLGVLVVEVKAAEKTHKSNFLKAAKQVMDAKNSLRKHLKDWVREEAINMVIALPNMKPENVDDVRKCCSIIRDHPEIEILCGNDAGDYRRLLQSFLLRSKADPFLTASAGSGSTESGDNNYEKSAKSFCSVPRYCLGDAVKDCAKNIKKWLLTEEQMKIRNLEDDFIHIIGPPGTGKTLLLLHRARRWLREGNHVAIVTGQNFRDVLLVHLGREAVRAGLNHAQGRLSLCRNIWDLWDAATTAEKEGGELCVIVDEVTRNRSAIVCSAIVLMKRESLIKTAWLAGIVDCREEWYEEAARSDMVVHRHRLSNCLRCSDGVMEILNCISIPPSEPTVGRNQIPLPRTFATETEIIVHPEHHNRHGHKVPYTKCPTCHTKLQDIFRTLRLIDPIHPSQLDWEDCVILYTGRFASDDELMSLARWLQDLGIPAEYDKNMHWASRFTSVLLSHSTSGSSAKETADTEDKQNRLVSESPSHPASSNSTEETAETEGKQNRLASESPSHSSSNNFAEETADTEDTESLNLESFFSSASAAKDVTSDQRDTYKIRVDAWRDRVLTGKSKEKKQRKVVHVMDSGDYRGLERPVVILVHMDHRDEDPEHKNKICEDERCEKHKRWWYNAISRCQGKLVFLALTPSPAIQALRPIIGSMNKETKENQSEGCMSRLGVLFTGERVVCVCTCVCVLGVAWVMGAPAPLGEFLW